MRNTLKRGNTRRKNIRKTKGRKNIKKYKGGAGFTAWFGSNADRSTTYKTIVHPNFNLIGFLKDYDEKDFMNKPESYYSYCDNKTYRYYNPGNTSEYVPLKGSSIISNDKKRYRDLLGNYYLSKCGASITKKDDLLCEKFKAAVLAFASPPTEPPTEPSTAPSTAPPT